MFLKAEVTAAPEIKRRREGWRSVTKISCNQNIVLRHYTPQLLTQNWRTNTNNVTPSLSLLKTVNYRRVLAVEKGQIDVAKADSSYRIWEVIIVHLGKGLQCLTTVAPSRGGQCAFESVIISASVTPCSSAWLHVHQFPLYLENRWAGQVRINKHLKYHFTCPSILFSWWRTMKKQEWGRQKGGKITKGEDIIR